MNVNVANVLFLTFPNFLIDLTNWQNMLKFRKIALKQSLQFYCHVIFHTFHDILQVGFETQQRSLTVFSFESKETVCEA